ncbi:hypothetical protein KBY65_07850 [Cyanobium sp. Alchichica 3B3-8F6]|uniref:alpha-ketoacid dehydrogenase subunit beta n=1 Tax=Cyanobium sp. Alchichica 3B3-8F6 TaxID=2823696 RepID=UPI0020CE442C|nr:transketolase C-terminal domain-containing protein [Cyanobium sp. Alchichica 3B3-8F6]MCP9882392.1 hypothetical protein [Cyanobium sp. Alchichica 3B3-8F6]
MSNATIERQTITYAEAIKSALEELMEADKKVVVYGLGVDDPKAMYGTLKGFPDRFGRHRCYDTPLSEDSLTGYGIGLAIQGYKPIHVHQRTDFLLLTANQLINMGAKISYLSEGKTRCPFLVRAITGRSWGQGAQHSQSFHSMFANIPGLRVLAPSTPADAYNVYRNAFKDRVPTIVIEHRMLYKYEGVIRAEDSVPNVSVVDRGSDITVCSVSHMGLESKRATMALAKQGLSVDHFSIVNISNPDIDVIYESVSRTGKLLFVDHGWLNCSIAKSIVSDLFLKGFRGDVMVLGYADSPCPTAGCLEKLFYPDSNSIAAALMKLSGRPGHAPIIEQSKEISEFRGPF